MKPARSRWITYLLHGALLSASLLFAGCGSHPDDKAAVYAALNKSDLRSITVKQDRHSGELTLNGIVTSPARKSQAEDIARQAAPEYTITNQIQVKPIGQ